MGTAFVVGGLATAAAIPLFAAVRRMGGPADRIGGAPAGVEFGSAAKGLPAVCRVEATALDQLASSESPAAA